MGPISGRAKQTQSRARHPRDKTKPIRRPLADKGSGKSVVEYLDSRLRGNDKGMDYGTRAQRGSHLKKQACPERSRTEPIYGILLSVHSDEYMVDLKKQSQSPRLRREVAGAKCDMQHTIYEDI